MDEVRARNSHHQGVIQASKQQRKYAAGLLCIISEFSMCTPCAPLTYVLQTCRKELNFISACSAFCHVPFLIMSFNPQHATLPESLYSIQRCLAFLFIPYANAFDKPTS